MLPQLELCSTVPVTDRSRPCSPITEDAHLHCSCCPGTSRTAGRTQQTTEHLKQCRTEPPAPSSTTATSRRAEATAPSPSHSEHSSQSTTAAPAAPGEGTVEDCSYEVCWKGRVKLKGKMTTTKPQTKPDTGKRGPRQRPGLEWPLHGRSQSRSIPSTQGAAVPQGSLPKARIHHAQTPAFTQQLYLCRPRSKAAHGACSHLPPAQ